ncbi:MAG: sulfatase-like hydrolase/transferase [Verrucomicrobiota bacterium]
MKFFAKATLSMLVLICASALAMKPNIVVIVADDLGLGDIGRQHLERTGNAPLAPTPTLDTLADEGMWFNDAHSPASLCAPSRYAFMSGNYNFRSYSPSGVWNAFGANAISSSDTTLGSITQAAGYTTGFVGKWHLGGDFYATGTNSITRRGDSNATPAQIDLSNWIGGGPQNLGFDYDFTVATGVQGPTYLAHENGVWYEWANGSQLIFYDANSASDPFFVSDKGPGVGDSNWDARALNMLLADKAAAFITAQATAGDPFFLYYCSPAVHIPHTPPTNIDGTPIAGSTVTPHLDMNRVLDLEVKRMVDALKANNVYDNTLIIFTSDNGGLSDSVAQSAGHNSNGGFRGHKNQAFEGGHRVPFIAVWPGVIPADTRSDSMINGTDILATLAAVVGETISEDQAKDSFNLLPVLEGNTTYEPRDELLLQAGTSNELMIRQGPWKLIISSSRGHNSLTKADTWPSRLFNLDSNPTEADSGNMVNDPAQASRVSAMFERYWEVRNSSSRTSPLEPDFIYVDGASGSNANSGESWGEAVQTISQGLSLAKFGDQVWVAAGTYNEAPLDLPAGVSVYGGFANGQMSIDGRDFSTNETIINPAEVRILDVSAVAFDGFTVSGASGTWVSALRIDTSDNGANVNDIQVSNCKFTNNNVGPAVILIRGWKGFEVSNVVFENCDFFSNTSSNNYTGIFNVNPIQGTLTLRDCTFYGNTAGVAANSSGAGLTFNGGSLLVENCLFYDNLSENADRATGIMIKGADAVDLFSTTFGNGDATSASGNSLLRLDGGSSITVKNCIFAGSPSGGIINSATAQTTLASSVFFGNVGNNIGGTDTANTEAEINALGWASNCAVGDPIFAADYSILPGSAAIDFGEDGLLSSASVNDLAGNPRVAGLHIDAGAFEIQDQDGDGLPDDFEMEVATDQPTNLSPNDDGDNDGIAALAEFAFGLNPALADSENVFWVDSSEVTNEQYLTISYQRSRSAMTFLETRVLRSTNLATNGWQANQTTQVSVTPDAENSDLEQVVERSDFPMGNQDHEFLRIEVVPAP